MFNNDFPYTSGIYCYVNLINDKKYTGLGKILHERIGQHENNFVKDDFSKTNCGESKILWNAIKKHGRDNFIVYIVEFCEINRLEERETYWIKELRSHVTENGYNILWGGFSRIGTHHTPEMKEQISRNTSGVKNHNYKQPVPQEIRDKISASLTGENNPNWGTHRSEETKRRSSISNTGQIRSDETRRNISNSVIGEKNRRWATKEPNASSKYYGVRKTIRYYKSKITGIISEYIIWRAEIKVNSKQTYIGESNNEIKTAMMYDKYVIEHNINRPLNFPEKYVNGVYNG